FGVMALIALVRCAPNTAQTVIEDSTAVVLPDVTAAQSLSKHYVEVIFSGAVGSEGEDAARYEISGPNDSKLAVTAARRSEDASKVVLTTDAQSEVLYTLKV